jgi:bifunctional isochorismate lyase/aryl carrier protein
MGIPVIQEYEVPTGVVLAREPLPWSVQPRAAALLVHDMQNYFLARYESERFVRKLVANVDAIRRKCHTLGIPTFYTAQPGNQSPQERGLLLDMWGRGLSDDPHACAIVQGLEPIEGLDRLIQKRRYSAFARTRLFETLKEQGRTQLIVSGVYAHIGCLVTATEAFMQDIQPFVVADALADFSLAHHDMALRHMAHCSSRVMSTAELLSQLGRAE